MLVGRDTRGSGPALGEALARGIVSAGGVAVLAGVLPTPAVALLSEDVGAVVSASHNPREYNGVKLFDDEAGSSDEDEEAIEALVDAPPPGAAASGEPEGVGGVTSATSSSGSGQNLAGLRIDVDCANQGLHPARPGRLQLGAEVHAIGVDPDGAASTWAAVRPIHGPVSEGCELGRLDLGVAFDGGRRPRSSRWTSASEALDGDQILAVSPSPSASTSSS